LPDEIFKFDSIVHFVIPRGAEIVTVADIVNPPESMIWEWIT